MLVCWTLIQTTLFKVQGLILERFLNSFVISIHLQDFIDEKKLTVCYISIYYKSCYCLKYLVCLLKRTALKES